MLFTDFPRVYPVGQLDADSKGLLLLTNDGELTNRLTHPRYGVPKTYRAVVRGDLSAAALDRLRRGMHLPDFRTGPARVRVVASPPGKTVLEITIHEGRNRQVRRMLEALGYPVRSLRRTRFGPIELGTLAPGRTRPATARELTRLRELLPSNGSPERTAQQLRFLDVRPVNGTTH